MGILDQLKTPALQAAANPARPEAVSPSMIWLGLGVCVLILLLLMVLAVLIRVAQAGRGEAEPAGQQNGAEAIDAEIVAVIMAAIAEMEGHSRFYIRNITAIPDREAWIRAGLEEQLETGTWPDEPFEERLEWRELE